MIRYCRFTIGRLLVHLGLLAMPPGRVRSELTELFGSWGRQVQATLKGLLP